MPVIGGGGSGTGTLASAEKATSPQGDIQIFVEQLSQDPVANTSQVQVRGWLVNKGTGTVTHTPSNITAAITGSQSFTGANFGLSLAPGASLEFISHTFTVTHNSDGTKTVNFTVAFGNTGTTTFGNGWTVSTTLPLTQIFTGVWVRTGGKWKMAIPYVRTGGKWKKAVPYIRTGGIWKPTN